LKTTQIKERIIGLEDKVAVLKQQIKTRKKLKKYKWKIQHLWFAIRRPKLQIIGLNGGEKVQAKGIENIFNKIIGEIFPTLKRQLYGY
jgi:hypothetical protein